MQIEKTKLKNELTIASDRINDFESVSLGLFVNIGSVNENNKQVGLSHFLEHMAFKGTKKRNAKEISEAIEEVGGHINAYTSKEVTAFHVKILKSDVKLAVDIITDIVQNSIFDEKELEKERNVIIQEIRMQKDTPDDYVFDMFQSRCFDNERLGTQILGSEDMINSFSVDDMKNYINTKYSTDKMIFCASGNIDHKEFIDISNDFTNNMKSFDVEKIETQKYKGGFIFKKKELEQTHLIFGFEGVKHTNENKFNLLALSMILGSGMSSRLFQEIREKRGLVYSIFSFNTSYKDTGSFGTYAACEHEKANEVISIIKDELHKIKDDINNDEIKKAKKQIKTSVLMSLESSTSRMERLANQFLLQEKFISIDELNNKIDSINRDSIIDIYKDVLSSNPTLAVIGNSKNIENLYENTK